MTIEERATARYCCSFCGGSIPSEMNSRVRYCSDICRRDMTRQKYGYKGYDSPETRFWRAVDSRGPLDCWNWTSGTTRGYGVISIQGRGMVPAHRFSYELIHGSIPDGKFILHSCDNRRCVNPQHLRAGTHKENMVDMSVRERSRTCKLTAGDVIKIQDYLRLGTRQRDVAALFGISQGVISQINRGTTWKHVTA